MLLILIRLARLACWLDSYFDALPINRYKPLLFQLLFSSVVHLRPCLGWNTTIKCYGQMSWNRWLFHQYLSLSCASDAKSLEQLSTWNSIWPPCRFSTALIKFPPLIWPINTLGANFPANSIHALFLFTCTEKTPSHILQVPDWQVTNQSEDWIVKLNFDWKRN